jgi:predicted DNA-binding transcriptional regulator AlpA
MNPPSKLTKSELAQRLGISSRQVDVLVARNDLPPGSRSGRHLYWVEAVVAAREAKQFADQIAWAEAVTA